VRIETMKVVFILSVGLEGVGSWEFFVSCEAGEKLRRLRSDAEMIVVDGRRVAGLFVPVAASVSGQPTSTRQIKAVSSLLNELFLSSCINSDASTPITPS